MWPNYFEDNAGWKSQLFTPAEWRQLERPHLHVLFELPYLSMLNIEPDELHILHLGTTMYLVGSVLWCLVYKLMPESPVSNMHKLWGEISS